jgi:hypothetical protein
MTTDERGTSGHGGDDERVNDDRRRRHKGDMVTPTTNDDHVTRGQGGNDDRRMRHMTTGEGARRGQDDNDDRRTRQKATITSMTKAPGMRNESPKPSLGSQAAPILPKRQASVFALSFLPSKKIAGGGICVRGV